VLLSIRPEHLALEADRGATDGLEGTVLAREYRGHDVTYRVQVGAVDCLVHTDNRTPFAPGDAVWVRALEPAVVLEKVGG
jgi:iron(III) transport system ATP-binding protein